MYFYLSSSSTEYYTLSLHDALPILERVPQHVGPETPLDMLNRPEPFFPFRPKKGSDRILLVAKARTVTLSVPRPQGEEDRKSTRLNSSHLGISYAVFCLKKKIKNDN